MKAANCLLGGPGFRVQTDFLVPLQTALSELADLGFFAATATTLEFKPGGRLMFHRATQRFKLDKLCVGGRFQACSSEPEV